MYVFFIYLLWNAEPSFINTYFSARFYLAYLIGEFPSNFLLQRWVMGRTLSIYMLCWVSDAFTSSTNLLLILQQGVCVISVSAAQDWSQLMAIRALQGFFECTISPGFVLIVGTWYRTEEHAARALFWQSANAGFGIISSLVNYGIGVHAQKYGGLEPWRAISLFLGACTLILAVLSFALLGSPKEVRWLSKEEKRMA